MRESLFEELISAYLDGELPADERLLVEKQLAQSAQLRQLYEDLKRQHETLNALPRFHAPADLAARIVAKIESTLPTPAVPVSAVSIPAVRAESYAAPAAQTTAAAGGKRTSWKSIAGLAAALAACLLAAFLPKLTELKVAKEKKPPIESIFPDEDRSISLAAFEKEFANKFGYLMVYDFSITPLGQKNRIFEKWMEAAGLHVEKPIVIQKRLEKAVLESRFIGEKKIAGGLDKDLAKDDVEMIFVRSTAGKIEALYEPWRISKQNVANEIDLRLDMVMTPPDLRIFLQLNDAVQPYDGDRLGFIESWTRPGAYRMEFPLGLHTVSNISSSESNGASSPAPNKAQSGEQIAKVNSVEGPNPANAPVRLSLLGTAADEPSQILIIVRRLKEVLPGAN